MNKYAEIQKIAVLYAACRGILRIKLAATEQPQPQAQAQPQAQPQAKPQAQQQQNTQPQAQPQAQTQQMPTANGTTGGFVPRQQQQPQQKRTWGGWFQDMLDYGNDYVNDNGLNPTRRQEDLARQFNAKEYNEAQQSLANGEYNGYNPMQSVRAIDVKDEGDVVKDENAAEEKTNGNGTTVNVNLPEGYGSGGNRGGDDEGYGGQQYQSLPGLAGYINQYSQYRNTTA